jgi:uncharacterized UBP type Zn finger protein
MNPDEWCQYCQKGVPSDHDGSSCQNCGRSFCESLGDVQLGLCRDCIKALNKAKKAQ